MPSNIVELIQSNLGYPPIQKIDPNTQQEKSTSKSINNSLAQAAIPTVAIGFFNLPSVKDRNQATIEKSTIGWLEKLFGSKKNEVIKKVADYSHVSEGEAETEMEKIAAETDKLIHEKTDEKNVNDYLNSQRSEILKYMPPALQIGEIFDNDSMDDRTHKMEGPMSNMMHSIEGIFPDTEEPKDAIEETFKSKNKSKD
jgi:hypothetical protein